ncbi:DUF2167 domain-containing protein [Paenibacillus sp. CAA11]|uniref:DUF2167 domain-containing protein n=1 Tax=Paenibacillus sp. CAA11 TaxID=1532905 RepID=UPI000D366617|nr:DUF2167 domain-containing protein [Paenibacillus sp. CAA11]AWB44775.1 DUF2167 domain-containing protein [Paenibacillus sp. CAA11]
MYKKAGAVLLLSAALLWTTHPSSTYATEGTSNISGSQTESQAELNWIDGTGQEVKVGDLAKLKLDPDFLFLNGADAQTLQRQNGGNPTGLEIGAVFPKSEDAVWGLFFEYEEPGHVEDSEKDDIDADALLESYKQGTEEANKTLTPENQLFIDGWDTPPKYDDRTHNLSWSLLGHDSTQHKLINYNVRLLTREGYISAILVSDPEHLAADRATMESKILSNFSIVEGQRYQDFNKSTDKKAKYGLTGLILGGAGLVVAKKTGLLAMILLALKKVWFVIIAGIVALWKFISSGIKKKKQARHQYDQPDTPPEDRMEIR